MLYLTCTSSKLKQLSHVQPNAVANCSSHALGHHLDNIDSVMTTMPDFDKLPARLV